MNETVETTGARGQWGWSLTDPSGPATEAERKAEINPPKTLTLIRGRLCQNCGLRLAEGDLGVHPKRTDQEAFFGYGVKDLVDWSTCLHVRCVRDWTPFVGQPAGSVRKKDQTWWKISAKDKKRLLKGVETT